LADYSSNNNNNKSFTRSDKKEHLAITMASTTEEQTENNADTINNSKRCMEMLKALQATDTNVDSNIINDIKGCMEMLNSFPVKSNFHNVGMRLREANQPELARDAFQRGSETGCVPCMLRYSHYLYEEGKESMIHLRLPWLLEGAIRGHAHIINFLVIFYSNAEPAMANSLQHYWTKSLNSLPLSLSFGLEKDLRKKARGIIGNVCFACSKEDSDDRKFQQCSKCKFYSYCSKECQLSHWKDCHRGECKQIQILNTYHKPYAKQIHEKITRGDDPKDIRELQELRNQLGLARPKEEYEELLLLLGDYDDVDERPNRREYIVARDDGTVHIGSTSEAI
jgi:hypothetical protein